MFEKIKRLKRVLFEKQRIKKSFKSDCCRYMLWQYNTPGLNSRNALEAKILRQAHILEKGMSLSHPKPKFGEQKAIELLDFFDEYTKNGYDISMSTAVINSIGVLKAYLNYHEMFLNDDYFRKKKQHLKEYFLHRIIF